MLSDQENTPLLKRSSRLATLCFCAGNVRGSDKAKKRQPVILHPVPGVGDQRALGRLIIQFATRDGPWTPRLPSPPRLEPRSPCPPSRSLRMENVSKWMKSTRHTYHAEAPSLTTTGAYGGSWPKGGPRIAGSPDCGIAGGRSPLRRTPQSAHDIWGSLFSF